jgi:hypothetical protein
MSLIEFGYQTAHVVEIGGGSEYGSDGWLAIALPWLVAALLFALAGERVDMRPAEAQILAICAAILTAPRALVTVNDEPRILWWLQTAACTLTPWLAIVHPVTLTRVWLAVANTIFFLLAAVFTAFLFAAASLAGYVGIAAMTLPWLIPATAFTFLGVLSPKIPLDAVIAAGVGAAVLIRGLLSGAPALRPPPLE